MKIAIPCLTALGLSACAVGPNFKPPHSLPTDRYMAADAQQSFAGGADVPYQWWVIYGSTAFGNSADRWSMKARTEGRRPRR